MTTTNAIGTQDPIEIAKGGTAASTATASFDNLSPVTTQGDIIFRDASNNARLAKGTANQRLTMNATATAPEWQDVVDAALPADLQSISDNTGATADTAIYYTALNVAAPFSITSAGRAMLDDADNTAQRTTLGLGTIATQDATAVNIDGGTIDGATIATSNITVGAAKTLDVSAGTLTLADNQISGDKVEGGTIAATTITALTSTTVRATTNIGIGEADPITPLEITGTDPHITLHDNGPSDLHGYRSGKLQVRGTQSGGEESTLGYLNFSHEGTLDDERGQFGINLNTGAEGSTPSNFLALRPGGNSSINENFSETYSATARTDEIMTFVNGKAESGTTSCISLNARTLNGGNQVTQLCSVGENNYGGYFTIKQQVTETTFIETLRSDDSGSIIIPKIEVTGGTITGVSSLQTLTDGASISWDVSSGSVGLVTLGGARALANPTNVSAGESIKLIVKQDATGARTLTYGNQFRFPGGTSPTLSSGASDIDIMEFLAESSTVFHLTNIIYDSQT